jgi:hypothetical protein
LAASTETAFPAGDDLLRHGSITNVDAPALSAYIVDRHDLADELMAGDCQ